MKLPPLAAALLLLCPLLAGAKMTLREKREALSPRSSHLENYTFDAKTSLEMRLQPCPEFLLAALKELDGKSDYEAYAPTPAERTQIAQALASLPAGMRSVLKQRLVGIYLIKNLTGNGLSYFVIDEKGRVYSALVINPVGFNRTMSETLTARDASLFKSDPGLSIDAGTKYKGIIYTVLHESTHAFDYISGITPFVEPSIRDIFYDSDGVDASWDIWERYKEPKAGMDLPWRKKLSFYGFGGSAPLKASQARDLYIALSQSPFASLYGSQSWAEDAADLATFYHLTQVLKQPYVIRLSGEKPLAVEPMKGAAMARARKVYDRLKGPVSLKPEP